MGYNPEDVIVIALGEVGYLEKASNSALDSKTANPGNGNYTKYARDVDSIPNWFNGKKQGQPWCATFVNDCFIKAYGVDSAKDLLCQPMRSLAASCKYAVQYYQKAGRFSNNPELGAQIFFTWGHTGIVVAFDSLTVITVEGNSVNGRQEGVWKKSYRRDYDKILGYGCPNFSWTGSGSNGNSSPGQNPPTDSQQSGNNQVIILPVISNGSKGECVRSMQILLEGHGYSCGRYGTDGECGPDTCKALRAFQKEHDIPVTGECNLTDWSVLLGIQ